MLRGEGRDLEALALFRQAYEAEPSARALAQMALAEQALGRWAHAREHLVEALESSERWIARRRPILERARRDIESHLGRLAVVSDIPGARFEVGARDFDADGRPQWIAAGEVSVTVRAPGHQARTRTLEVHAGELTRDTVQLTPRRGVADPPRTAPSTVSHDAAGSEERVVGTAIWVAGAVLVAVALGTGIWLADRQSELSFCEMVGCRNRSELEALRNVGLGLTVGLGVVGGGGLTVGLALAF